MDVQHHFATINGIRMHYVEAGRGPLVVLLHGFPDFWYSWRHQIPALVHAGYRVIAPDMRGYAQTEAPPRVTDYHPDKLTADIAALIEHVGDGPAHLVGHDWGAAIAWFVAMWHPERIETCSILNVPHPKRFNRGLWRPRQLLRSWYMFFFQLPWLPEKALQANALAAVKSGLRATRRRDAVTEADLAEYEKAFSHAGAMRGPVSYYRCALRDRGALAKRLTVIDAPTMVIWGRDDAYLGLHLAEPDRADVPKLRMEYLDASHWVHIDETDRVNELLTEFMAQHTA